MKLTHLISAVAACAIMGGTALADGPGKHKRHNNNRSGSVAAGAAVAGPNGGAAVGGAASGSSTMAGTRCIPSSAATTSNNTTYTQRDRAEQPPLLTRLGRGSRMSRACPASKEACR